MKAFDVIIKPILSEKSNEVREAKGKYTFQIKRDASKSDVKKAVSKLWGVEVLKVQTMITRGKVKRRGANLSKPTKTKKAVVTLQAGAKLPLFEDQ